MICSHGGPNATTFPTECRNESECSWHILEIVDADSFICLLSSWWSSRSRLRSIAVAMVDATSSSSCCLACCSIVRSVALLLALLTLLTLLTLLALALALTLVKEE